MLKSLLTALAALLLTLAGTPAAAQVIERSADHFVLRYEIDLESPPEDMWVSLEEIGQWWDSAHTYSGDASNMTLVLVPGGCFCEKLADGAEFEHGRVIAADPETGVLLDAPLGPLKGKATMAQWSIGWTGAPQGGGWRLVMTFVVRGPGLGALADGVDSVMRTQYGRFTHFLHYGEAPVETDASS